MSISYETAKRLKDAGFPLVECEIESCTYIGGSLDEGGRNYHYPTLEELIETCGDKFAALYAPQQGAKWVAAAILHDCRAFSLCTVENHITQEGDSPLDALANLWLSLQEKV